ncbi:hypothetical protein GGF31_008749 [Allomyces arbusculus]|nr:hypothetical protein GGF31_008749 [Allomyces arbusculus]
MSISPITARYEAARKRKSPTFVPVPCATLSSEWLHELGDLLDVDPIQRDYVECAVDWICDVIKHHRDDWTNAGLGAITRIARVGSLPKDTAICVNFDADLVVHLRDLDVIGDGEVRQAAEIARDVLAPYLQDVKDNWTVRKTPDERNVRVTLNKLVPRSTSLLIAVAVQPLVPYRVPPFAISMDVLFTLDCLKDDDSLAKSCLRPILYKLKVLQYNTENDMSKDLNRRLQPLASEAAQQRVRGQDPLVRSLIRIVKAWNLLLFSTSSEARARSTVLETIVLIIVDQWPEIVDHYKLSDKHQSPTIGALFLEVLRQLAQVESMQLGDRLTKFDHARRLHRNCIRKSMRKDNAVLLNRVDFLNNLLSSKALQVFSEDYREELAEATSFVLQGLAAEKITTPFGILLPQNRLFTTSRLGFHLCLHVPNDAAARTFPTSSTTSEWFKATNFHRQLTVYLLFRARDVFSATAGTDTVDDPHALITRSETTWSRVWSTAAELSLPKGDKADRQARVDWRTVPHGSWCQEMCFHQVGAASPAALDNEFARPLRTVATDVTALLLQTVRLRIAHKAMKRAIPSAKNSDQIVVAVPVALGSESSDGGPRTAMLHLHVWSMRNKLDQVELDEEMIAEDDF